MLYGNVTAAVAECDILASETTGQFIGHTIISDPDYVMLKLKFPEINKVYEVEDLNI